MNKDLQRALNAFTHARLAGIPPLIVDGKPGEATSRRIRWVKFYLGYAGGAGAQNDTADHDLRVRMNHPKDPRYSTPARIARGIKRRAQQRTDWKKHQDHAGHAAGVTTFDGVPVAAVAVPILKWCRQNGWHGKLVSGYRDPAYSEKLCYRMCGAPRCPGKCAGKSSNHVGITAARFAIDVSDYQKFALVVAKCPLKPRIHNSLPVDLVHFSPAGN